MQELSRVFAGRMLCAFYPELFRIYSSFIDTSLQPKTLLNCWGLISAAAAYFTAGLELVLGSSNFCFKIVGDLVLRGP